jgi:two-component system nitrate/nitrite response regulator NarL
MGRTVLIVDDHHGFRGYAARLLRAGGFEVIGEAKDGSSALMAARRLEPELVLLDVLLPDMSGFAVAEELAGDSSGPQIVLISSRSASELGAALEESRADGFIAKGELTVEAVVALADGGS